MKILAALDLSAATPIIIRNLQALTSGEGAELWLLHVAEPDPAFVGFEVGPQSVRDAIARKFRVEHKQLREIADSLRIGELEVKALLVQGATAETVLEQAEKLQVDLIVVGSHGHGAIYGLLLGSVSEAIIRNSKLPILVVPTHGRR